MSEEFQESEVTFSDEYFTRNNKEKSINNKEKSINNKTKSTLTPEKKSSPVSIPCRSIFRCMEDEEEEEERMTPPHVIIGERRKETQMAFSFCALRGRDLRRHRNSVLRMTGFLEV
ncbi:unnamed protein product [Cochlearia groenlandica]